MKLMKRIIGLGQKRNCKRPDFLPWALWGCIFLLTPGEVATAQLQPVVAGNTEFALNLYAQLAPTSSNLFFSPYSISTALAMTYAGAASNTAAQMAQIMGFGTNQPQFATNFGELQDQLEAAQATNAVQLDIANALWTQEGFPFLTSFLDTVSNQYQASINQANFLTNAAAAVQQINSWVEQKTQNKIRNILSGLPPLTVLVLANAIYFQGIWTESFAVSNTINAPFSVTTNSQIEVPLMHQLAGSPTNGIAFNCMAGNGFQAIELPYGTNQASMLILLPSAIDGLPQLEQQLTPEFLNSVLAQMTSHYIEVFLPRFTLESSLNLTGILPAMGMANAFTPGLADFSGIDGRDDLFISLVLHKAWGQVNEAGTEAAAATVVAVSTGVAPSFPTVFRADHPFLFFIRDTQTGSLLFIGRVITPTQSVPALNIASAGQTLKITWPYPSSGWSLRQNLDLRTTNWTPTAGITNDGTNNFISITPPSSSNMFFRLSR